MSKSFSNSYKEAGVDITAGYRSVEMMKQHIAKTMVFGNTSDVGGFGGLMELDTEGMEKPVLVSGTDGVGTKLKMAFLLDKHDTVGIDCVAMCVNDIICVGAKPLCFLWFAPLQQNHFQVVFDWNRHSVPSIKYIKTDALILLSSYIFSSLPINTS